MEHPQTQELGIKLLLDKLRKWKNESNSFKFKTREKAMNLAALAWLKLLTPKIHLNPPHIEKKAHQQCRNQKYMSMDTD